MHDKQREHEPSDEEWAEIEEAILREEQAEKHEEKEEDLKELDVLKWWLERNGMLWI